MLKAHFERVMKIILINFKNKFVKTRIILLTESPPKVMFSKTNKIAIYCQQILTILGLISSFHHYFHLNVSRRTFLHHSSLSYVDTAVSVRGHFQDFRPGFRFWHIQGHVDRHAHFTVRQLRLPALNETHTNSYTGPKL